MDPRFKSLKAHHFIYIKTFGSVAQLVRAPACHAGGRGFEPHPSRQIVLSISIEKIEFASVAQSVEHETENLSVGGSIPPHGTNCARVEPLVLPELNR